MSVAFVLILCLVLLGLGLRLWRWRDHRADRAEAARLRASADIHPPRFSRDMVADLPEPARRYFKFAIREGTPLHRVADLTMQGQFGPGTKAHPNYMPMRAAQVLAAPDGFVWTMTGGAGGMRISGSDSGGWSRFWLAGLIPVARAGGTRDHALSAFGRAIAEAAFWTPAALLPGPGIQWEAPDDSTARVTVTHEGRSQSVDLHLDGAGCPQQVVLQRWSNANAERVFRFQPFGGTLSAFQDFDGFRLPTHVEGGNLFGTEAYFPFYIVDVTQIRFGG